LFDVFPSSSRLVFEERNGQFVSTVQVKNKTGAFVAFKVLFLRARLFIFEVQVRTTKIEKFKVIPNKGILTQQQAVTIEIASTSNVFLINYFCLDDREIKFPHNGSDHHS
jgi:hypothetical protein